uniref:Lysosome-associated membrane glycoprotein 5 n=1 Tax=Rhabditophanes sp. KR3021 TaxID=114890 RepID=A0AC35TGM2_9BILA
MVQQLKMFFAVLLLIFTLYNELTIAATPAPVWTFSQNGNECIKLQADQKLTLAYFQVNKQPKVYAKFDVPSESSVDKDGSSCQMFNQVENMNISSQVLKINFDEKLPGWSIIYYFSDDSKIFKFDNGDFGLYRIVINANYTTMPDIFDNPVNHPVTYVSDFDLGDPKALVNSIYTTKTNSFFCPSKQKFVLIPNHDDLLEADITFKNLRVQAFVDKPVSQKSDHFKRSDSFFTEISHSRVEDSSKFQPKDYCPADQIKADLIPIIVGSVIVFLIVCNLIFYLIYRCRLTNEALTIVNNNSHFADSKYDHIIQEFHQQDIIAESSSLDH